MKILITGATGIIGRKLIERLKQTENRFSEKIKYQLKILIHQIKNNNFKGKGVEIIIGDLLNLDSLNQATLNVDTVVHLAGLTHSNRQNLYYQINTIGTENLLKVCQQNKVKKFIYISSRAASNNGGAYARSKLLAERKVEQSSLNWVILQLAEVYGAGDKEAIYRLVNLIKKSCLIPIIGDGRYLLSPVFVDDVIFGIIKAIEKDNIFRKRYILAGPEEFSYNEIVSLLLKIFKVNKFKIYLPLFLIKFLALFFYIIKRDIIVRDQIPRLLCKKSADIDSAKKDLNYNPRKFEIGIRKILNSGGY